MIKSNLKAATISTALTITVFVVIGLSVIGFYFAQNWIREYAIQISETTPGLSTDSNNPQALKQLRSEITKNQLYGDIASSLVVPNQNYQNQIIKDLNKYASANNITITNFNLTQVPSNANTPIAISGVTPGYVTITLTSPVSLQNLLKFFKSIESNLPKMQILGIELAPSSNSSDMVTISPLTIAVYTR